MSIDHRTFDELRAIVVAIKFLAAAAVCPCPGMYTFKLPSSVLSLVFIIRWLSVLASIS